MFHNKFCSIVSCSVISSFNAVTLMSSGNAGHTN